MTYHKATYYLLSIFKKPLELIKIAKIALILGIVKSRKIGMSDRKKVRSFVETVKRNIRDIFNNDPKLIHPENNTKLVALPEWDNEEKNLPIDRQDEIHRLIGRVSSNFNGLEKYIQTLITQLIGAGQQLGEIITSELSFRNLISLLFSLYKFKKTDKKYIDKMDKICKKANELEQKRNQVIHSTWAFNIKSEKEVLRVKTTSKYKKGLNYVFENKNINELHILSDDIVKLISEVSELIIKELPG
jgi:hypothetical protein